MMRCKPIKRLSRRKSHTSQTSQTTAESSNSTTSLNSSASSKQKEIWINPQGKTVHWNSRKNIYARRRSKVGNDNSVRSRTSQAGNDNSVRSRTYQAGNDNSVRSRTYQAGNDNSVRSRTYQAGNDSLNDWGNASVLGNSNSTLNTALAPKPRLTMVVKEPTSPVPREQKNTTCLSRTTKAPKQEKAFPEEKHSLFQTKRRLRRISSKWRDPLGLSKHREQ